MAHARRPVEACADRATQHQQGVCQIPQRLVFSAESHVARVLANFRPNILGSGPNILGAGRCRPASIPTPLLIRGLSATLQPDVVRHRGRRRRCRVAGFDEATGDQVRPPLPPDPGDDIRDALRHCDEDNSHGSSALICRRLHVPREDWKPVERTPSNTLCNGCRVSRDSRRLALNDDRADRWPVHHRGRSPRSFLRSSSTTATGGHPASSDRPSSSRTIRVTAGTMIPPGPTQSTSADRVLNRALGQQYTPAREEASKQHRVRP